MWKFLFVCAVAVSVQGRTFPVPQFPSQDDRQELLNDLRTLLKLRSDSGETGADSVSVDKSITDLIKEKYEDLFSTMASEIEDGMKIAEPIAYVIEKLNAERPDIVPCLNVAQLIGALRFAMVHELQPGMYYTLRGALEMVMMETGHVIDLNATLFRNIGHAVLKPVFDALEELECDIGISTDCPASTSAMLPNPSPMEQLYLDTKTYMDNVDFTTTPVGTVITGFLENVWVDFLNEKFTSSYTCDSGIKESALTKLESAVEKMAIADTYDLLKERLGSVITDTTIVNRLAHLIVKEHFVDKYMVMKELKEVFSEAKNTELNMATNILNGFVLSMIYESTRDKAMFDTVLEDVMGSMDTDTLNRPLHELPVEDLVRGQYMMLNSVMRHWKTPCLNARLIGMLAGFVEVQKTGALNNPRLIELFTTMAKQFGLSIMDKDLKTAYNEILDITLVQPFEPFIEDVLRIAGNQPTELAFIDIYERLLNHTGSMTVEEGIHMVLSTIVPLMRHDMGDDSAFTCEVSIGDLLNVLHKAYGIVDSLKNEDALVAAIKAVLNRLPTASDIPEDALNAFPTRLMDELKGEVLSGLVSGLQILHGVTGTDATEKLTTYLAATLGYSIKYIVDTKRPSLAVPVQNMPTNPTEFVAWQNKLVSNFVAQYISGITQYNMVATNEIDICTAMPQLCTSALSKDLPPRHVSQVPHIRHTPNRK